MKFPSEEQKDQIHFLDLFFTSKSDHVVVDGKNVCIHFEQKQNKPMRLFLI